MKLENLRYKERLDKDGEFESLEIWQGTNKVIISLGDDTFGEGVTNSKWNTVKQTVDKIQSRIITRNGVKLGDE